LASSVFIDVEEGENCPYSMQLVFSALDGSRDVRQVRLYHESDLGALYDVVAWDNADNAPSAALGAAVEDSGEGRAYLIHGGSGGLRFRPASSGAAWDLAEVDQWGRSHLLLSNLGDIVWG
jgi:hypothetical protein